MASALRKPITADTVEQALDDLAEIMVSLGAKGKRCLPIYQRLEDELARLRDEQDVMSAVMARAKRSKDRRAATPC